MVTFQSPFLHRPPITSHTIGKSEGWPTVPRDGLLPDPYFSFEQLGMLVLGSNVSILILGQQFVGWP